MPQLFGFAAVLRYTLYPARSVNAPPISSFVVLADQLGYHAVWEVEHHGLFEYSHSSAPEVFLAYCAGRTKRIKLGHGVTLARGLLVADALREGRVVCPFPIAAPSRLQYYVVCHPERHADDAITALREWLRDSARATVADLPALMQRSARAR